MVTLAFLSVLLVISAAQVGACLRDPLPLRRSPC
jgi:hypothetical protein